MTIKHTAVMGLILMACAFLLSACRQTEKTEARKSYPTIGSIERLDPRIDKIIPPDTKIEILAQGHDWTEGPVWVPAGRYLLYSDIPRNAVYKWKEGEGATLYLRPSGFTGSAARGGEPGSNGLLLDAKGRLVLCQHGDRRIARMDAPLNAPKPIYVTLADKYQGKRLNSPNDAAYHTNGDLYFTDPPYGLEKNMDDPGKEIPFQGVYRLKSDGTLTLLTDKMTRPNGIGLSPDHKTLYVANSDPKQAVWMAYDVKSDGTIAGGRILFDATQRVGKQPGLPDGLSVSREGYLFATGPGGVLIFAADGTHLGTILTTQATANCELGDDGTLYITADMYLLRVRTHVKGR